MVLAGDGYPGADHFAADATELRLSRAELLQAAGIDDDLLDRLEAFGLVKPRDRVEPLRRGRLVIAKTAGELAGFGLEPRHLRAFKTAADREVGLIEQVVSPMQRAATTRPRRRGPTTRSTRWPPCPCGCTRPWSRAGCALSRPPTTDRCRVTVRANASQQHTCAVAATGFRDAHCVRSSATVSSKRAVDWIPP